MSRIITKRSPILGIVNVMNIRAIGFSSDIEKRVEEEIHYMLHEKRYNPFSDRQFGSNSYTTIVYVEIERVSYKVVEKEIDKQITNKQITNNDLIKLL